MKAEFHGEERSSGVYVIRNTVNNWFYLGETRGFRTRQKSHLSRLIRGKHPNPFLSEDFRVYGKEAFTFEVIAIIQDETQRQAVEVAAIRSVFGTGCYNAKIRMPYRLGIPHSDETRQKLSAKQSGRKLSAETRAKIGVAGLGRKHSEEAKEKIAASKRGLPRSTDTKMKISETKRSQRLHHCLTDEHKAKISSTLRGRPLTEERKLKMREGQRRRHALRRDVLQRINLVNPHPA